MKSIKCACIFFTAAFLVTPMVHGAIPTQKLRSAGEPKIRVLLEKQVSSALLEAKGDYAVVNRATGELLSSGTVGKRFVAHALQEGLRWGEEYPDVYQLTIFPRNDQTSIFVNGFQYKGSVSVYHTKDNTVTVVNEVGIEDFLNSTLSLKLDAPFSNKEAMAAFIIDARTDVYGKASQPGKKPWDVTAAEVTYYGCSIAAGKEFVAEALENTKHMIVDKGGAQVNSKLSREQAQELADKGFDAKRILQNMYPGSKLGLTMPPKTAR